MKIIDKYIFKELCGPFFQSLSILTVILMLNQVMISAEMVINKGLGLIGLFRFIMLIIPPFMVFTLPASVLVGSIVTFARMSEDSEIIVLRAAGLSLLRIITPVIIFSLAVTAVTFFFSVNHKPWSERSIRRMGRDILKKEKSFITLEPDSFNMLGSDIVIHVDRIPQFTTLEGVFISDTSQSDRPKIIVAESAVIANDIENGILGLKLSNGSIHMSSAKTTTEWVRFASYNYNIKIASLLPGNTGNDIKAAEARAMLHNSQIKKQHDRQQLLKIVHNDYKNYTYPLSALMFGILGAPLGIANKRAGKSGSFVIGIGLIVLFYLFNMLADNMVMRELLTPAAGAAMPVLLLAIISVGMIAWRERVF